MGESVVALCVFRRGAKQVFLSRQTRFFVGFARQCQVASLRFSVDLIRLKLTDMTY